jgi:hypothetical protein
VLTPLGHPNAKLLFKQTDGNDTFLVREGHPDTDVGTNSEHGPHQVLVVEDDVIILNVMLRKGDSWSVFEP